jgi:hypothetical protein
MSIYFVFDRINQKVYTELAKLACLVNWNRLSFTGKAFAITANCLVPLAHREALHMRCRLKDTYNETPSMNRLQ